MDSRPYAPSFVDRLMGFVCRLPVPYALTYFLLFVLEVAFTHLIAWADGWLAPYQFSTLALMFPMWLWGPLAIMTYLNTVSLDALTNFRPLVDISDEAMARMKYEFTTMPARAVLISSAIWTLAYIVFAYLALQAVFAAYGFERLAETYNLVRGWISFFIGSALYYHTVRQLRLVNRTVRMVKRFDLFQLEPVYAFSALTSRTAVAWVVLISLSLLTAPIQVAPIPTLVLLVVQLAMGVAAFVLPLRTVNARLVGEKRKLLAELALRLKGTLASLHRCLDEDSLADVCHLNTAISGLNAEREILARVPTWPWRPGMLTGFLSIVVLPILLFIIQLIFARWFGG